MRPTTSTEFLALAEQCLKLHPKYVCSIDELVGRAPLKWRLRKKRQKSQQEYIANRLQSHGRENFGQSG